MQNIKLLAKYVSIIDPASPGEEDRRDLEDKLLRPERPERRQALSLTRVLAPAQHVNYTVQSRCSCVSQ